MLTVRWVSYEFVRESRHEYPVTVLRRISLRFTTGNGNREGARSTTIPIFL